MEIAKKSGKPLDSIWVTGWGLENVDDPVAYLYTDGEHMILMSKNSSGV